MYLKGKYHSLHSNKNNLDIPCSRARLVEPVTNLLSYSVTLETYTHLVVHCTNIT